MKLQQAQNQSDFHNQHQMLAPQFKYLGETEEGIQYTQLEPTQLELFQQQFSRSSHYHPPKQRSYCTILIVYLTIFLIWYMLSTFLQQQSVKVKNYTAVEYFVHLLAFMITVTYTVLIRSSNSINKNKKIPLYIQSKFRNSKITNISDTKCRLCTSYKLPRMSHCNTCGSCIYKLDHHCTFTQNCVSFKNQKVFLQFLWYLSMGNVMFWYYSVMKIWDLFSEGDLFSHYSWKLYIVWLISLVLSILLGAMIVVLTIFHTVIICTNYSTLQMMKRRATCQIPIFQKRALQLSDEFTSLFNRGIIQNYKAVFSGNIIKCFLPTIRQPQNEYLCQLMSPQPTQRQIKILTEQLYMDMQREQQIKRAVQKIKLVFEGRKFKIHNEIVVIHQ